MTDRIPTPAELAALPDDELRALADRLGVQAADVEAVCAAVARAAWETRGQPDALERVQAAIRDELATFAGRAFDASIVRWTALRDAAEFMEAVCIGPGEIEVRAMQAGRVVERAFFASALDAAEWCLVASDGGLNAYFAVARRMVRRGFKAAAPLVGAVTIDLDPAKSGESLDAALERVYGYKPSVVVGSGAGLHVYWLLQDVADAAAVARVNRAARDVLGGDPGHDASSAGILRLPGTVNHKHGLPVRILQGSVRRHELRDLETLFALEASTPAAPPAEHNRWDRPALLDRLLEVARGAVQDHDQAGRRNVRLACPFHDDEHPSAVVYIEAWFHCPACGVSERGRDWTKRPEVQAWDLARLASGRRQTTAKVLRAPRTARHVTPLLSAGDPELTKQVEASLSLIGKDTFPWAVRTALHAFWTNVALAQMAAGDTPRTPVELGGWRGAASRAYPWSVEAAAKLQGYSGRLPGSIATEIMSAQNRLAATKVKLSWSSKTEAWRGPIVTEVASQRSSGLRSYVLHPVLFNQMVGRSQAWFPWSVDALRLQADALRLYLAACWRLERAHAHGPGPDRVVLSLPELAREARAAISPAEWRQSRRKVLRRWAEAFAAVPGLGLVVDVDAPHGAEVTLEADFQTRRSFFQTRRSDPALPPRKD